MTSHVKIGTTWQEVTQPYVKVGSTWQTCTNVYVKVGTTWQEAWAAGGGTPTVSPRADGDTNLLADYGSPIDCYVGCDFDIDGDEWENTSTGTQTNSTVWLDSGSASDVWVEFVRTGGTVSNWDSHTSGVRYQLNVNQRFSLLATSYSGIVTKNIIGYFRMWPQASGGTALWTGNEYTWQARASVLTGDMCSIC